MATREALERRIVEAIDLHRDLILEVAETIRQNPEIAFQEPRASALLAASIQRFGYEVEKPIGVPYTLMVWLPWTCGKSRNALATVPRTPVRAALADAITYVMDRRS